MGVCATFHYFYHLFWNHSLTILAWHILEPNTLWNPQNFRRRQFLFLLHKTKIQTLLHCVGEWAVWNGPISLPVPLITFVYKLLFKQGGPFKSSTAENGVNIRSASCLPAVLLASLTVQRLKTTSCVLTRWIWGSTHRVHFCLSTKMYWWWFLIGWWQSYTWRTHQYII